jgi:hypothetical protein
VSQSDHQPVTGTGFGQGGFITGESISSLLYTLYVCFLNDQILPSPVGVSFL